MPRFHFDAQQDRIIPTIGRLERRCKFLGMDGHNTIIRICRENEGCRIDYTCFDIVQGRIGVKEFEVFRAGFGIAVI